MNRFLSWGVGAALAVLGVLKLSSPHSSEFLLPQWAYLGAALAEVAIAVLVLFLHRSIGLVFSIILFASGAVVGLVLPEGNCGCFGDFGLLESRRTHVVIACIGAMISTVALRLHRVQVVAGL